jgi:nucleotide-binding universal stress UspA family protein
MTDDAPSSPASAPSPDAPAPERPIRRILVALDASPHSRAALDAAARVASDVGAGLQGLFIKDESILRAARLPIAEEVRAFTRDPNDVGPGRMKRQLRYQAEQAKALLQRAAERADLPHDFTVAEGRVADELLAAAGDADLLTLGKTSHRSSRRRLGVTARTVLSNASLPVLVAREPIARRRPIVTYFDGSDPAAAALRMAALLAGHSNGRELKVLLPARTAEEMERLRAGVLERYGPQVPRLILRALDRPSPERLAAVARSEEGGLVVVPGTLPAHDDVTLQSFLYELDSPVLVVR